RTAPFHELLFAELGKGLSLVLALERTVVALVEAPRALHGNPEAVGRVKRDIRGLDRAAQQRGVQHVRKDALLGEHLAATLGFASALLGEPDIDPTGEQVLFVPVALSVTE